MHVVPSPQPPVTATELELRVHNTGVLVNNHDAQHLEGYDVAHDTATGFEAHRLISAPVLSDTGQRLGVITLLRGSPVGEAPEHLWHDARLAPFAMCVPP